MHGDSRQLVPIPHLVSRGLTGIALTLTRKSLRWFPGAPMFWSIPLCAAFTAYGGYPLQISFFPFHLGSLFVTDLRDRYQTSMGDSLNGAGITAAWSFAWVLMNTKRCLRIPIRRFGGIPLAVFSLFYANVNWIMYGSYYFLDADTARRTNL